MCMIYWTKQYHSIAISIYQWNETVLISTAKTLDKSYDIVVCPSITCDTPYIAIQFNFSKSNSNSNLFYIQSYNKNNNNNRTVLYSQFPITGAIQSGRELCMTYKQLGVPVICGGGACKVVVRWRLLHETKTINNKHKDTQTMTCCWCTELYDVVVFSWYQ